ncbi:hypothetical protein DPMN_108139 [Dreissena polymorpha]|uniref:Uncharacterized protein n=1 Tax=Dreissena polymorpha TaxID=45954 RepID=A0A9D4K8A2_DREPO|nr:hypothetical protein DPMN_108139 [Dreissena polymorpha]
MRAMKAVFTLQQLMDCSMKGAATFRHGIPCPCLPKAESGHSCDSCKRISLVCARGREKNESHAPSL